MNNDEEMLNQENEMVNNEVAGENMVQQEVVQEEMPQEEIRQEVEQETPIGDSPMGESNSNKNNKMKLIILLVIVFLALGSLVAFLFMGQSTEEKFFDLLLEKNEIAKIIEKNEKLAEKSEQVNNELELNIDKILEKMGSTEELGIGKIELNINTIAKGNKEQVELEAVLGGDKLLNTKIAMQDDLIGINVEDLVEDFIVIRNNDLKDLAEKFGADSDELPNKILTEKDLKAVMKMKESDFNRIENKYMKVITDGIKGKVEVIKNQEVEINGEKYNTTKYLLKVDEKTAMDIILNFVKELKDDRKTVELVCKDVCNVAKLYEDNGYDMSEFNYEAFEDVDAIMEALKESYENMKESYDEYVEEDNFSKVQVLIATYEYKGHGILAEISVSEGSEGIFSLSAKEGKDDFIEFSFKEDENIMAVKLLGEWDDKKCENTLSFTMSADGMKIDVELLKITTEYLSKAKEEIVDLKDELILNDATEEEIKELGEQIQENIPGFVENLSEIIGENFPALSNVPTNPVVPTINDPITPTYNYEEYDPTNKPGDFKIDESKQVKVLDRAKTEYNKIYLGMKKDELKRILGEADYDHDSGGIGLLEWDLTDNLSIVVYLSDEKVTSKSVLISSRSYANISLSKELNTKLQDLKSEAAKIKRGMTLKEVEAILGTAYFESGENTYSTTCEWYDVNENKIEIDFKDGKVDYIGSVYGSY